MPQSHEPAQLKCTNHTVSCQFLQFQQFCPSGLLLSFPNHSRGFVAVSEPVFRRQEEGGDTVSHSCPSVR